MGDTIDDELGDVDPLRASFEPDITMGTAV
jgi:hypothetical protein